MRIKIVGAILKKEIIDILRDKKTIFMGIVLPLILYPILMIIMTQIMSTSMKSLDSKQIDIAFSKNPNKELVSILEDYDSNINIVKSNNYKDDLEKGTIDAYINIESNGDMENYKIYINSSKENASIINSKINDIITSYKDTLIKHNIEEAGLNESETLEPITSKTVDLAKNEEIAGSFLGQILPIILIMGVLIGSIYPAIDSMAGEKERGTLETLFTLPITNLELVMGKYLAVSSCAIVTAILNVISILITTSYLLVSGGVSEQLFSEGLNISQLIGPLFITLICICLFAMVISAISMCVCSLAKSFKDAQNYITPVMFLVLIPSYVSMIPTMELNRSSAIIPVVNVSLLIKSVLSFNSNIGLIALVFVSNFAFVILSVILLSKIFNSEEILFGNSRSFSFLEKRSNIKKGTMPSVSDGVILYAIGLVLLIYVGSLVQLKLGTTGVIITEIMILTLPIIFAYYIKSDFKKVFRLKLPKVRHLVGAIFLWVGIYILAIVFTQILLYLFPQNMEIVEGLNNAILSSDSLLVNLIIIALMPAICEEVFFRGFLLTSFSYNKKSYTGAIIACGVLFGFMHMDFIRIVPTSLLGIAFAYAVCKTESIGVSMFMHFINNAFSVIVSFYSTKYITEEVASTSTINAFTLGQVLTFFAISAIFIFISIVLFRENKKISVDN